MEEKQYGLIKSNKQTKISNFSRLPIFESDSDEEMETMNKKVSCTTTKFQKRQVRALQNKALQEDPNIFLYDELHDDLKEKSNELRRANQHEVKSSKYISKLILAADKRKMEYERRVERQVQKEREEEVDKFIDKESFITSSYKEKLEKMRLAEIADKTRDYLESINDVTKQNNLDVFYQHLYEQKVLKSTDSSSSRVDFAMKNSSNANNKLSKRSYRSRDVCQMQSDSEEEQQRIKSTDQTKRIHLSSNLDADSDFSIDTESEKEDIPCVSTETLVKTNDVEHDALGKINQTLVDVEEIKTPDVSSEIIQIKDNNIANPLNDHKNNIWEKRTVGQVYNDALNRYYNRKLLN